MKENFKKRADSAMASAMFAAASRGIMPVYAEESKNNPMNVPTVEITSGTDPTTMIGKALGLVLVFAEYIGAFLFIYGAFMLFLAMKNDEPESKSRAIMTMVAGAALYGLKTILSGVITVK